MADFFVFAYSGKFAPLCFKVGGAVAAAPQKSINSQTKHNSSPAAVAAAVMCRTNINFLSRLRKKGRRPGILQAKES